MRHLTLAAVFTLTACSYAPHPRSYAWAQPGEEPIPAGMNTESYARLDDNPFLDAKQNPRSTFSIDVDTASYANVRRFLASGTRPPKDAVRIEELVNYFPYRYPAPTGDSPFAVHAETLPCPWSPTHRLVKLGIKGRELETKTRPAANLVFLLDVSGSMTTRSSTRSRTRSRRSPSTWTRRPTRTCAASSPRARAHRRTRFASRSW